MHSREVNFVHTSAPEVAINTIKRNVNDYVSEGVLDQRVINELWLTDCFVPKETELWDFKREPSGDSSSLAKTVLQIVSFHNTYGGYLIYGIEEPKRDYFRPIGIASGSMDTKQLRDKVAAYTGETIDLSYVEINCTLDGAEYLLGLLHIPKRASDTDPVYFGKNGPNDSKSNKPLFRIEQAYIRFQDNCVPADKRPQLKLLFGDRTPSFGKGFVTQSSVSPLNNNLPDRNLICSKLVGRENLLEDLWRWFGDPFCHAMVLAGEGGKGKSSIAYEFAEDVCRSKPQGLEKVIWLTGKKAQFNGLRNDFTPMPETHFDSARTLMEALAQELAVLNDDIDGASDSFLKKQIKDNLSLLPALVVVDDVDSLILDQQKKVMELAMQVANSQSRFLLTTRMNLTFSSDQTIEVPGLSDKDFRDFCELLCERFNIVLKAKEVKRIEETTGGSPLFAESLFRLIRLGVPVQTAINEWKGQGGDSARQAALRREIEQLTLESRRVLLALSYMLEASQTEIRQVTGYNVQRFETCINELMSLFLVDSPRLIRSEPRYKIQANTALLLSQLENELVTDPRVIEREVKKIRSGNHASKRAGQRKEVGVAINQALALLREGRASDALKTIDNAAKTIKKNPDLLLMRGRCLLKQRPPKIDEARKCFREAYDSGQRREILYDLWYGAEVEAEHPNGIVEVSQLAIKDLSETSEWLSRRAYGKWLLARSQQSSGNHLSAISNLREASKDFSAVIRKSSREARDDAVAAACKCNDEAWALATSSTDRHSMIVAFDIAVEAIERGDLRNLNFSNAMTAIKGLDDTTETYSQGAKNFLEQRIRKLNSLLALKNDHQNGKGLVEQIKLDISRLEAKFET